MKKLLAIMIVLIFLVSCAKVETGKSKEMPDFLKKAIEYQIKKGLQEEAEKQLEESGKLVHGIFLNQGIILGKEGGNFDVKIKNNDVAGNFKINIEKSKTVSGNDINFEIKESSFYLAANSEKTIKVYATPSINPIFSYKQDFFPIKATAEKDGNVFSEANVIITVNAQ